MPGEMGEVTEAFIEYYNWHRYHEGPGDVTLYAVNTGSYPEVIVTIKELKTSLYKREGTVRYPLIQGPKPFHSCADYTWSAVLRRLD